MRKVYYEHPKDVLSQSQLFQSSSWRVGLARLMPMISVHLYQDMALAAKLVRILVAERKNNNNSSSSTDQMPHLIFFTTYILPVVSLATPNPAFLSEVWDYLSGFSYRVRYRIYQEWSETVLASHPLLADAKSNVLTETRKVMRRLSKENVKQYGRSLAKLSHANPVIVFNTMMEQIQAYENLVLPIVDCLKYLTTFGTDVLGCKRQARVPSMILTELACVFGSTFRFYSLFS